MVLPAAKDLADPPVSPLDPASSPAHAVRPKVRAAAVATTAARVKRILHLLFDQGRRRVAALRGTSVREDLGKEVLGPVAARVREELLRRRLLDELTVGHEHD